MFEGPPSSVSRQFSASEAVGFAVGCNGGHEIEEGKDDLGAGVRVNTERDEGRESVSGKLGILTQKESTISISVLFMTWNIKSSTPFSPTLKSS